MMYIFCSKEYQNISPKNDKKAKHNVLQNGKSIQEMGKKKKDVKYGEGNTEIFLEVK